MIHKLTMSVQCILDEYEYPTPTDGKVLEDLSELLHGLLYELDGITVTNITINDAP
jgi:hypothetical protein